MVRGGLEMLGRNLARDHMGIVYESTDKMCEKWGIKKATYLDRIKKGWTLKNALITPVKHTSDNVSTPSLIIRPDGKFLDHMGNLFNSREEMWEFYGYN